MFSIFIRKKVNINSVVIPDFNWTKSKDNNSVIQWIDPEHTIAISINFFDLPPDIPTISNVETLREFYRNSISAINGGLIEVDILKIKSISVVKTIFKIPQEQSGMTYLASLTIPFANCSFVIKIQCAEIGTTGMREAIISNKFLANDHSKIDENRLENWFSDPYDKNYKDRTLMNISEQKIYDDLFPNHPLTKARILIDKIEKEIIFNTEIEKLEVLNK